MIKTYLAHHGIKGQRWGIRRFQNEDGSLTAAGRRRYDVNADGTVRLKEGLQKKQNIKGAVKVVGGAALLGLGAASAKQFIKNKAKYPQYQKNPIGKLQLRDAVLGLTVGAIVVTAGAKALVNANLNKSFNSVGKGATPENFKGKPKTLKQVQNAQKKTK